MKQLHGEVRETPFFLATTLKIPYLYRAQTSPFIIQMSREILVARSFARFTYILERMRGCHFVEASLNSV